VQCSTTKAYVKHQTIQGWKGKQLYTHDHSQPVFNTACVSDLFRCVVLLLVTFAQTGVRCIWTGREDGVLFRVCSRRIWLWLDPPILLLYVACVHCIESLKPCCATYLVPDLSQATNVCSYLEGSRFRSGYWYIRIQEEGAWSYVSVCM
jgi:hypothetical protein